jgi:hypothetical protein
VAIASAVLRAARLQIVGSGQGSLPTRDIPAELPNISAEIATGAFHIDARPVPLTATHNGSSSHPSSSRRPRMRPWPAQCAGHGSG